jgi:hypothetical protein
MFINADFRFFSKGLEAFVPNQRLNSIYSRLVEMTDNGSNAWRGYQTLDPQILDDSWYQLMNEDNSNENFSVYSNHHEHSSNRLITKQAQKSYSGNSYHVPSSTQTQAVNPTEVYSYGVVRQSQPIRMVSTSYAGYPKAASNMNYFDKSTSMPGTDYSQFSRGDGSFSEFSGMKQELNDFPYQSTIDPDLMALTPSSSAYINEPTFLSNYDLEAGFLPMPRINDGLPRCQNDFQQPQYCDVWTNSYSSGDDWGTDPAHPNAIHREALTFSSPSATMSSSGSSQGAELSMSGSSVGANAVENRSDYWGHQTLSVHKPPPAIRRPRHPLPNSAPTSHKVVPMLPSNDYASSKTTNRPSKSKSKPADHSPKNRCPSPTYTAPITRRASLRSEMDLARSVAQKKIVPKPHHPSTKSSATTQAMHHRNAKDDFLIKNKLNGMSYKDIRRQGNFAEAESTLRGRFRTLTKHKSARVRDPKWLENDVSLAVLNILHSTNSYIGSTFEEGSQQA